MSEGRSFVFDHKPVLMIKKFSIILILIGIITWSIISRFNEIKDAIYCNGINNQVFDAFLLHNSIHFIDQNNSHCAAYVEGILAMKNNKDDIPRTVWMRALQSSAEYLGAINAHFPTDRELAEIAITDYPSVSKSWEWAGDAWKDEPEKALQYYQQAARLAPSANLVWEKVSDSAEKLNHVAQTLLASKNACEIYPIRNGSCHRAARLFFKQGDWESTIHYFLLGAYPEHAEDWALMISAAQHLGRDEQAKNLLTQAQQENPADYAELIGNLP
jgi:tetratricopeptide (TPR) repeat protein